MAHSLTPKSQLILSLSASSTRRPLLATREPPLLHLYTHTLLTALFASARARPRYASRPLNRPKKNTLAGATFLRAVDQDNTQREALVPLLILKRMASTDAAAASSGDAWKAQLQLPAKDTRIRTEVRTKTQVLKKEETRHHADRRDSDAEKRARRETAPRSPSCSFSTKACGSRRNAARSERRGRKKQRRARRMRERFFFFCLAPFPLSPSRRLFFLFLSRDAMKGLRASAFLL